MVTEMEKFFAKYLGGRAQTDVPAEIAERLKVLIVDPKTVDGSVTMRGPAAPAVQ